MIHAIFGLPALYVIARVVWPLPWPVALKLAVALVILVASQFHFWNRLSSGSIFDPEFARPLVILFNWAIGVIVLLSVAHLIIDAVLLASKALPGPGWAMPAPWRYGVALLMMGTSAYAVSQAIRVPPLKDVELSVKGLPTAFDGYRLLQLTDLHISRLFPAAWTQAVVERSLAADVDLIVVTGDFIDGTVAVRRSDVEPLRGLKAKDGVWAITGNHEYFFGATEWMDLYADMGLRVLANAHTVLRRGDASVVLAGVTDLSARGTERRHDLKAALTGAPPGAPVILLDHQPRAAREAAESGVALQLSGHTHGGMILGLDRIVARANGGFVSGRYDVGGMTLYVNNGTGLWPGFALRLGRPAELTRITLRASG